MKLLVMTEEGRQKLREKQQQRESKRRPGLTLEEVLAAMTEVDLDDMDGKAVDEYERDDFLMPSDYLLAHIKEGK